MDERSLICPQCGAQRRVEGSYIVCDSCGSKNVNNILSSEEEVLLIPAKDRLLAGDFDDATIKYSNIIDRFPKCYEAYWGSALAKYGIQFVDDLREKKKVPTIHNTRIETIKEDSLYLNAIKYAPKETRENYEKYADMIETIRLEWIEKASKEKPYDVFICFKDSDLEHGIERTEDSVSASELYTFLSREGYNVFFSRESLRDKISEQYEPYIFNALNTAKAMIVYGSKAEYIESTWVKNEWRRYICKIRNGEKYANSLIIAYEKMPISSLPREFQSLQCLDASKKTYYPDLLAHLKKVMENAKKPVSAIEHREIKTGQVGKKAASVVNAVKKIDLGGINVKQVSASENTGLNTAMVFLDKGMFPNAISRLSAVLEINPTNAKAIWFSLLARLECKNNDEFVAKSIKLESFRDVKDAIENADKDEASVYIDVMCEAVKSLIAKNQIDKAISFFEFVMNYQSKSGDALREFILEQSLETIVKGNETTSNIYFEAYTKCTENIDTDKYINLCAERLEAAAKFNLVGYMRKMIERIIAVDEGNVYALWWNIRLSLNSKKAIQIDNICEFNDYTALEKMLGYCKTTSESDGYVVKFISSLIDKLNKENCEKSVIVFDSLISYVKGDSQVLKCLRVFAQALLKFGQFELAEKYYAIVVTRDNSDFLGYWGLLKAKLKCKNDEELTANDVLIDTTDEFNSAINAASAKDTKQSNEFINKCIELSKDQPEKIAIKKEKERIEKEKKEAEIKRKKKVKTIKTIAKPLSVLVGIILMIILTFYFSTTEQYVMIIISGLMFLAIVIFGVNEKGTSKGKKAILATILVVSMAGTHFGMSALMKKDSNGDMDMLRYSFHGDTVEITGLKDKKHSGAITIPSKICGKKVTEIGYDAFRGCKSLTSVTIPDSVTKIGSYAFDGCSRLTSVTIPDSVKTIGDWAFYGCNNLTIYAEATSEPYLWDSDWNPYNRPVYYNAMGGGTTIDGLVYIFDTQNQVTMKKYIGTKAEVVIPASIDDKTVVSCGEIFKGNTTVKSVKILATIKRIGNSAFYGCTALTSVTMPASVTEIGNSAFDGCAALTSVTIPNGVTTIGNSAFRGCTALTSINIPSSVTTIGNSAFDGCAALTSVTIPNGVTTIGNSAFRGCTALTSINIPSSVTTIGNSAFYGCTALTSINIPSSVTTIGNSAFYGCTSLTSVTIPNGVTSIGSYAFDGCSSLASVTIPSSVTKIGAYAFSGCTALTSINIPSSVTTIGNSAFYGCKALTSVTIPNGVTSIGESAFRGCAALTSVTIPNSVTAIGGGAFSGCTALTSITIPSSVTTIDSNAFNGCTSLTSVTIPASVTTINNGAFDGCSSLTSVTIPNSVTSIGGWAFSGCTALTSITIPSSVTKIGAYAFSSGCTALTIYAEAASKPAGWDSNWNSSDCKVVWGSKG